MEEKFAAHSTYSIWMKDLWFYFMQEQITFYEDVKIFTSKSLKKTHFLQKIITLFLRNTFFPNDVSFNDFIKFQTIFDCIRKWFAILWNFQKMCHSGKSTFQKTGFSRKSAVISEGVIFMQNLKLHTGPAQVGHQMWNVLSLGDLLPFIINDLYDHFS